MDPDINTEIVEVEVTRKQASRLRCLVNSLSPESPGLRSLFKSICEAYKEKSDVTHRKMPVSAEILNVGFSC